MSYEWLLPGFTRGLPQPGTSEWNSARLCHRSIVSFIKNSALHASIRWNHPANEVRDNPSAVATIPQDRSVRAEVEGLTHQYGSLDITNVNIFQ
jgi:hypothetical protein